MTLPATTERRLWTSFVIDEATGCWVWTKSRTTAGYGHFHERGRYVQAHLAVYERLRGPIPAGLEPDHLCRTRACVNPDHVEFVTHAVNVRRGVSASLTPEQVEAIRRAVASGASQRAIAPMFGVDHSTISRLVRRLTWADLAERRAAA